MSWEHVNLNMTPGGELPVVHVSQFDTYRAFTFDLFVGEDEWVIPESIRFELHCRKVDDNIVIIEPVTTDTSSVTFITTEQLTACSGKNKCELVAIDSDDDTLIVGSINFILDVEPDPLAGGVTSETDIYNLTQQIEEIATEVIGEDYYDKTEVDALLADKADVSDLPDMSQYYTKTDTDALLNTKADAATTYTKSETDSLLSAKANTADLATVATTGDYDDLLNKPTIPAAQVQSDYAQADNTQVDYIKNKPDISGMIADAILAVMPVDTATGNPCTFDTDIATSLVGLSADIVASGGGGTPSTPIPIVGISSLEITANGDTFTIDLDGTRYGGTYTNDGKLRITHTYIADMSLLNWQYNSVIGNFYTDLTDVPKVFGSENYLTSKLCSMFTIVDGSVGSVNHAMQYYNSYLRFRVEEYSDVPTFKQAIENCQFAYELATPIEIDVSPISVDAVVGTNNISSNGNGDVTAQYKVSIQKYIDDNV